MKPVLRNIGIITTACMLLLAGLACDLGSGEPRLTLEDLEGTQAALQDWEDDLEDKEDDLKATEDAMADWEVSVPEVVEPVEEITEEPVEEVEEEAVEEVEEEALEEIQWVFYHWDLEDEEFLADFDELSELFYDLTGVTLTATIVNDFDQIQVMLLADYDTPMLVNLPPMEYIIAHDAGAVNPGLVFDYEGYTSFTGDIMVKDGSDVEQIRDMEGMDVCTLSKTFSGWRLLRLLFLAEGMEPDDFLGEIAESWDYEALTAMIEAGDCEAFFSTSDLTRYLSDEYAGTFNDIQVVISTPDIPNTGIHYSAGVSRNLQRILGNGLLSLAETDRGTELFENLFYANSLTKINDSAYDGLRYLLDQAGVEEY